MSAPPASLEESNRLFPLPESEARRADLRKWILNYVPKGAIGAEIGTFRGQFSEVLLKFLEPRKVYFVDPWTLHGEFFGDAADPALTAADALPTALALQEARWRAAQFPNTESVFIEGRFPECAARIDDKLDWLYLDADLRLEPTLAALQAATEVMAPKGILFGNEWWPNTSTARNEVFQALGQFTRKSKYELIAAGPFGQWAIRHRGAWKTKK